MKAISYPAKNPINTRVIKIQKRNINRSYHENRYSKQIMKN